ncbi:hypothetical protein M2236_006338 [Bradyrhizobium elkanii]|nr:hypothetical protein [Bradyrhizobium elkanii]
MLAIHGHWTAAIAVEVDQSIAVELQRDVDPVGLAFGSTHPRLHVGEVLADLQPGNTALGTVSKGLVHSRSAEETEDVLLFQSLGQVRKIRHQGMRFPRGRQHETEPPLTDGICRPNGVDRRLSCVHTFVVVRSAQPPADSVVKA